MIPSSEGDTVICIGTVFHKFGESEPSQGRLLLFKAELDARVSRKKRQLKQISELDVKGCVFALARVDGLLAAAIGPAVSALFPFVSAAESGADRFSCTKLTIRDSKKSRIGITITSSRALSLGDLGCSSATRFARYLSSTLLRQKGVRYDWNL